MRKKEKSLEQSPRAVVVFAAACAIWRATRAPKRKKKSLVDGDGDFGLCCLVIAPSSVAVRTHAQESFPFVFGFIAARGFHCISMLLLLTSPSPEARHTACDLAVNVFHVHHRQQRKNYIL